jgi:hypothetical protein
MARQKKDKPENAVTITLSGGPRDGDKLRMKNPPPVRIRLAFPNWCNYYQVDDTLIFEYDMDKPWVPLNELERMANINKDV